MSIPHSAGAIARPPGPRARADAFALAHERERLAGRTRPTLSSTTPLTTAHPAPKEPS